MRFHLLYEPFMIHLLSRFVNLYTKFQHTWKWCVRFYRLGKNKEYRFDKKTDGWEHDAVNEKKEVVAHHSIYQPRLLSCTRHVIFAGVISHIRQSMVDSITSLKNVKY